MTTPDTPWLDQRETLLWRRLLRLNALLPGALHRQLQDDADLSLPDFEVLVHLTESADGRMRVSDLARELLWERSRLSHQVSRMERRALVSRETCQEDGRGSFVAITASGREAIARAAPGHVVAVRRAIFDALTPTDVAAMARALDKIVSSLEADEV